MARTVLTVNVVDPAAIAQTMVAIDQPNGNKFANTGREFLVVRNTGAAGRTLTILTPLTVSGLAVAERTVVIPNDSAYYLIGPFSVTTYNQPTDRANVYLDIDVGTNVTIGAFQLPSPT